MGAKGQKYPPPAGRPDRDARLDDERLDDLLKACGDGTVRTLVPVLGRHLAELIRELRELRGRVAPRDRVIADQARALEELRRKNDAQASALEILRRERDALTRAVQRPAEVHALSQSGAAPEPATNDGGRDG